MSRARLFCASVLAIMLIAADVAAQNSPLTIVNTGPQGPLDQLAQANEIRIVFSEPMVTLGRIPERVTAPFVRITPAIQGTFRWSGTTILIFTPDPETTAAVRDDLPGHRRRERDGRQRPHAGARRDVHVHDADRAPAADAMVPARRNGGRRPRGAAPIQPAGQAAGRAPAT